MGRKLGFVLRGREDDESRDSMREYDEVVVVGVVNGQHSDIVPPRVENEVFRVQDAQPSISVDFHVEGFERPCIQKG
jgi:hypothetical protein